MNSPSVKVIVLNWNGKDLTLECLESLKKVSYSNYTIIIILFVGANIVNSWKLEVKL